MRPGGVKATDIDDWLNGEMRTDADSLGTFLGELEYPLYYLDYETLNPAVPLFDGTSPYEQVPFQFSLHIQQEPGGECQHYEFIHKNCSDPRPHFVRRLVELCGNEGSVVVYNRAFEAGRNNELAAAFPEYSGALEAINSRMVDLLIPFRRRWLYHPDQKSSASIKAVLPCFTDLGYKDMEIGDGGTASLQYTAFMNGSLAEDELTALWNNLAEYCRQDTWAMVELCRILSEKVD